MNRELLYGPVHGRRERLQPVFLFSLRKLLLESCNLHTILDNPGGVRAIAEAR